MFDLIFFVIYDIILFGIFICFSWVFFLSIVIFVLKLGVWILVISFILNFDFSLFFSVGMFFGGLLLDIIICLFVLWRVLNVWKNFFWVFFFFVINWILLISNIFMFLYLFLNFLFLLFFIEFISLLVNFFEEM